MYDLIEILSHDVSTGGRMEAKEQVRLRKNQYINFVYLAFKYGCLDWLIKHLSVLAKPAESWLVRENVELYKAEKILWGDKNSLPSLYDWYGR